MLESPAAMFLPVEAIGLFPSSREWKRVYYVYDGSNARESEEA